MQTKYLYHIIKNRRLTFILLVEFLGHLALLLEDLSIYMRFFLLYLECVSPETPPLLLPGACLNCVVDEEPVHESSREPLRPACWVQSS